MGPTHTTKVGAPADMAPETYDECDYTHTPAVDVYSFALIAYEVAVGQPAFPLTLAPTALMEKVTMGERRPLPANMEAALPTIVERGWSKDPAMRPSFNEIFLVLESIEFRLRPGIDSVRVRHFMPPVRRGMVPSEVQHLREN
jgi:serine/threonine protein kinase